MYPSITLVRSGAMAEIDTMVLHKVVDGVTWITLNRPDAGNALTPGQRNRIIEHLDDANSDVAVRAIVLNQIRTPVIPPSSGSAG